MLNSRRNHPRSLCWSQTTAPLGKSSSQSNSFRRGTIGAARPAVAQGRHETHALTRVDENQQLFDYERCVKASFDAIVPVLKRISALQHEEGFEVQAQSIAREQLGFDLPAEILGDAWVNQLDMRRLFAWCLFETYRRFCDEFFTEAPLGSVEEEQAFHTFIQDCGFHTLDVSPCADGRLAHVIRYVLRLPYRAVRRKSYAGAMFDVDDSIQKWVETEMLRLREGRPNDTDMPTRYLKVAVYHYSSGDPDNQGCAAHGSDATRAAQGGLDQLCAFRQAIENSFCCGASIDLLLIGLDTDTDVIRVHVPDASGDMGLERYLDADEVRKQTLRLSAYEAEARITELVYATADNVAPGMAKLITRLIANNFSQIDYVRAFHGEHYEDIGHAERFIGAGIGFEEVQLRNLTYFAYLDTVEEATQDLDVGVSIFTKLNVSHGLPIPVVVRYDYHGQVPGARERAIKHCARVTDALTTRYAKLAESGLLHTLQVVRDCNVGGRIEVLACSVNAQATQEARG
ncbi:MAG: carboxysome shell carbonic anhydrase [Gammaproteobacteria bacterium]|nr:carboxysome shell carbonic anhydrase [Gammaproteobacteria bacterium]